MVIVDEVEQYAASRGYPVPAGTTIVTGDEATVMLVRRGDSITVYPNSEVTIPEDAATGRLGVMQNFGTLLYRMETRESRNFEVRTPYLAATVKGTVFTVVVASNHAQVSVAEGMVRVTSAHNERSEMVREGWTATAGIESGAIDLAVNGKSPQGNVVDLEAPVPSEPASVGPAAAEPGANGSDAVGANSGNSQAGNANSGKSSRDKSKPGQSNRDGSNTGKSSPGSGGPGGKVGEN